MDDKTFQQLPSGLAGILRDTESVGFKMASEQQTGSLLRTLAASKVGGRFLELGTGTGVGTSWLLAGMDSESRLDSVENDSEVLEVARRHLGRDPRVTFHLVDGEVFLKQSAPSEFDLIYADTWPGKFTHLSLALSLLRVGGLYVIDDLLPQPSWPDDHAPKVPALIAELENRPDVVTVKMAWASGLMIVARAAEPAIADGRGPRLRSDPRR
jgi:predicted O-methyltransferase YrrM